MKWSGLFQTKEQLLWAYATLPRSIDGLQRKKGEIALCCFSSIPSFSIRKGMRKKEGVIFKRKKIKEGQAPLAALLQGVQYWHTIQTPICLGICANCFS